MQLRGNSCTSEQELPFLCHLTHCTVPTWKIHDVHSLSGSSFFFFWASQTHQVFWWQSSKQRTTRKVIWTDTVQVYTCDTKGANCTTTETQGRSVLTDTNRLFCRRITGSLGADSSWEWKLWVAGKFCWEIWRGCEVGQRLPIISCLTSPLSAL